MLREDLRGLGWIWSTLRPDLVLIIGVPLAALATCHVLLSKREVRAAIAWIGLIWFAPILGPILYLLFGISRVRRRAREARQDVRPAGAERPHLRDGFASLETAVETITGNMLTRGNAITVLRSGDEAYPAMLQAIDSARSSVLLTTYIMRPDRIGSRFIEALASAQGRGVVVRVILDGVGSGYFLPGAYGRLRKRGVPVRRFMHSAMPWRMPFLNLRSHKKLLIVDGRVAFVGGLNIGDEDVLAHRTGHPVRDTHFRMEGPISTQLGADFARDWSFVSGETLRLDGHADAAPPAATGAACRTVSSGPDEDIEKIELTILQAIACARHSIHMMTPYFLPGELVVTSLAMAAMRGLTVHLLVPARSNHILVDWASRAEIEPLLGRGVQIWRVPPPFDHSKLLVVDRAWSLIGSANMDVRSLRLNFELDVEAYDASLAKGLVAFMEELMASRVTQEELARRPLGRRLRDALARLALPYL